MRKALDIPARGVLLPPEAPPVAAPGHRFGALDGWRGISILLVLATHLLPLGPESWQMRSVTSNGGMAIFFALSGFLITTSLLENDSIAQFLTRRFFRIVPLAWLSLAIFLTAAQKDLEFYAPNFLFYANWPPMHLARGNLHFWSLCVEVQFYVAIAALVAICRLQWLYLIPLIGVTVTLYRILHGVQAGLTTDSRVDEILVGSILALASANKLGSGFVRYLKKADQSLFVVLFLASCHPSTGALTYLRPYLAAIMIGTTLLGQSGHITRVLDYRSLRYLAAVSYALYVIHPMLVLTWLGGGAGLDRLPRRLLLFAVTFALAHISTFHYEKHWIHLGKKLCARISSRGSGKSP